MTCVAITRGGYGEAWLFESHEEADLHPLIQYGDAIISDPKKVLSEYNSLDVHKLLDIIGNDELKETYLDELNSSWMIPPSLGRVFQELVRIASPVLTDPVDICNLVRKDRTLYLKERLEMAKAKKTDPKTAPDKGKSATPKGKGTGDFGEKDTIHFLADGDGKKYGPKNNPEREDSKRAERFLLYKDGMTVQAFVKAGGAIRDLKRNIASKSVEVKTV